jgi:hypothetical protein
MDLQTGGLIGATVIFALALIVVRWNSFEALSNLQTVLTILVPILSILALTVKLQADHLKKAADVRRAEERAQLDKELKEKTEALEARTRQRMLSSDQEAQLRQFLTNLPKGDIEFECPSDDREATVFASALLELFRSVGWNITSFARSQFPSGISPQGIEIGIHSPSQEAQGRGIAAVLEKIGLSVRVSVGNAPQAQPFSLLVGSKQ